MNTGESSELALASDSKPAGYTMAFAKQLAASGLIPRALQGKPADVLVVLLTGRELGLEPMQSLRLLNVIDGKPVMASDLIVGLCVAKPVCEYFRLLESTDTQATYETKRAGSEPVRLTFTIEQAKAANLTGKDNWRKWPAAMLRARCGAHLARAVYQDVVAGIYDPDELDAPTLHPVRDTAPAAVSVAPAEVVAKPQLQARARATEDAAAEVAGEPPPGVKLPTGAAPAPNTPDFDRHFESLLDKCGSLADLRKLAKDTRDKVHAKDAMQMLFLQKQRALRELGRH